ncbi:hypothetical protein PRIPAC_97270 [Pristionchus pacificus]|uniref:Endonuclease/exonuclease/phosphatase domain-containing protein n=1 Tax=Pristionchus pacificus TaxID=54126 RepID=A0A2A6D1Z7_PRIPA|nr:hypothetical protein PRIPAC_97270 [Pristionchus pacificus]|eukprot:PDM84321.1 hypothetical protein PRIPAC_33344 [Pristionchus pacificus]
MLTQFTGLANPCATGGPPEPPARTRRGHLISEQTSGHLQTPDLQRTPRHDQDLRICSLNARTLASEASIATLESTLEGLRYDVVCLQETKARTLTERTLRDGARLILGPKVPSKNIGGVGFLVHPRLTSSIMSFSILSPRLASLRLRIGRSSLSLISAYAPTSSAPLEERQGFFEELASLYDSEKSHFYRVIAGDLNLRVGKRRDQDFRTGPFYSEPDGDPDDLLRDFLSMTRTFHANSLESIKADIKAHRLRVLLQAAEAKTSLKKAKASLSKGRSPMDALLDRAGAPILSRSGMEERGPAISLNGTELEETNAYVYLGRELRCDGSMRTELIRRKRAAWAAYGSIREVTSVLNDAKLRASLFDAHVLPALCYAAETWPLSQTTISFIRTAHRALERSLIGTNLHTMRQTMRSSADVRRIPLLTDPVDYIKRAKHRWAGHVLRREDDRWSTRVTQWVPPPLCELTRQPGRPPTRWRDSIEEYARLPFTTVGRSTRSSSNRVPYRHWTTRARDREDWRNCDPRGTAR